MKWFVREYDEAIDLKHINEWLQKRSHAELDPYNIPAVGFVSTYMKRPIAAGFLREAECDSAIFDGLVSNPQATKEFRHQALDLVIEAILSYAKAKDINQIWAWSIDASTLERAARHGFVKQPHTLVVLSLQSGSMH